MWLLTHDGDHTQKKRYWLRPGTSHLLGRTRSDNVDFLFHIDHKSVSRKHLIITVRDVDATSSEALSSSSPLPRSEVVLTDASKYGTWLDGEKFTGGERVLGGAVVAAAGSSSKRESHEIKLGNWRLAWRLEWQPVVLTASISGGGGGGSSGSGSKKTKKSTSSSATTELSYAELRERLAPFDVAVVPEYAAGVTTHVVAPKRNNPRVLQALVEGRHVVSEAWVRALEERARKRAPVPDADGGDEVPRAPLEEDFDGSWPRELDFAPPSTNEPVPRPAEMLAPDAERETVFAGYTFVFSDGNQFAQLGPVVEQGTGKALLRELETGSDDTDGFIRYVKNVAGEKGVGEFEDGSEGKGVVVSQYPGASQARTRTTKGKKRQHEPEETVEISDDDDANAIDKLFPATSAMKRRKLEQQLQDAAMESISEEADAAPVKHPKKPSLILPSDLRKSKPETKPVNPKQLAQLARERREKEDEERKKDEEALQEALEGMDIEQMKNLVKVEVMEIRPRKKPVDTEGGNSDDERWKPEWNGRKNFKKFRKRRPGDKDGAGSQAPLRSRRVIVTLQEVEANAAPEDDYLLDNTSTFDSIRTRPRPGKASASDSMRDQAHARKNRSQGTRSMGGTTDADDDDDDDDDDDEEASGFFSRSNLRSGLNRSNNSNSGPASAIALGSEDEAEMQDLDREEIAGRPRNENIASALSSAVPPPHPPPPYSQRAPCSPAPSSQTLADSSTQHHHHHPNRPNSRASVTSASTTNTTTTKRGAMGPPAPSAEQPPPKKQRQTGAAATGRGKAKAKGGGGGKRPGRPVAPALLGRGLGAAPRGEEDDDDDEEDEDEDEDEDEGDGDSDGSGGELKFRRRRRW
ncbi:putative dna damage response protein [Diplodia seriata]|uniref:Putative dna damage response protein n=1 Tax=Diplodia seriata TaxID=420778 RepID=A0A0G2GGW4_9PEZI|nr:putative dna damage response protein [Diplodia seriata]